MSVVEREVQVVPEVLTEREERARVLEAAALEVEVRGWAQDKACDDKGRVCAIGAAKAAMGFDADALFIPEMSAEFARVFGNFDWGDLPEFNDKYGRTAAEVTFVLRWRAEEIRDGR